MEKTYPAPEISDKTPQNKLSVREKVAYGLGGGGESIMANLIFGLAYPIYQAGLGIDARLIGLAVGIPRLWDALVDPVIGNFSDNAKTRWGRRKPFIFLGAFLTGVICMLMWMPPVSLGKTVVFTHFFICSILYFTCYAIFIIPYYALGYEMSQNYDERTSVMSFKLFFTCLIATFTLPMTLPMCFWFGHNKVEGARIVGMIFGGLMILFGIMPALLCRERACHQDKIAISSAFKESIKNKPFRIVLGLIFLMMLGIYLSQPMQYYINMAYILPGKEVETAKYLMYTNYVWGIMGFASVPVVNYFSRRYGKTIVLQAGLILTIVGMMLSWFYYTPKNPWLQLFMSVIVAPGMTCMWVILGSFVADICDVDELNTYRRREGMFGAVYNMAMKAGVAFTMVISGFVVSWTGYQASVPSQSPDTIFRIRLLIGFIPTIFLALAFILTFFYPLTRQQVSQIRSQLDARQQLQSNNL